MNFIQNILKRRQAYRRVFLGDKCELTEDAKIVLADLAKFCRAQRTVAIVSPLSQQTDVPATFLAEGRREVWWRIWQFLHQDDADLHEVTKKVWEDEDGRRSGGTGND